MSVAGSIPGKGKPPSRQGVVKDDSGSCGRGYWLAKLPRPSELDDLRSRQRPDSIRLTSVDAYRRVVNVPNRIDHLLSLGKGFLQRGLR